jgi:hypothetical protein
MLNRPDQHLPSLPEHIQFSREFLLLAACSWIAPQALQQQQAKTITTHLENGIDWELFIELTDRHRFQTLAYGGLSRHAVGKV